MKALHLLILAGLLIAQPAGAGHDWVGIDLCRIYPERMPPELAPGVLPDADSPGARLLGRYCGQCHFAPGPGQHTAPQWAEVVPRMGLLMTVTARFAGRSRPLEQPSAAERDALLAYLQRHALRPLAQLEEAPPAYLRLCGDCHAVPDPKAYPAADWPRLLGRMAGYRATLSRGPAAPVDQAEVESYLKEVARAAVPAPDSARTELPGDGGRWLALGPFCALALWGARRWYRAHRGRA